MSTTASAARSNRTGCDDMLRLLASSSGGTTAAGLVRWYARWYARSGSSSGVAIIIV